MLSTPARRTAWAVLLLLAVAALPRLIWPDLGEVLFPDELRDYHRTILLVEGKDFPVDGPTRWGRGREAFPGGMWHYLMAIPYSLSRHPAAGLVFQNLLGALSVLLLFLLGRRMFGFQAGFWAALLYAASPWAILLGRKLWNPHLAPFFALAFFYLVWRWFREDRPWFLVGALPLLAILLQIHPIFLPMALALPVLAVLRGSLRRTWLPVGLGMALALLMYAPLLVHEATHGYPVVRSLFVPAAPGPVEGPRIEALKSLVYPFLMTTPELSDFLRRGTLEFYGVLLPAVIAATLGLFLIQGAALGRGFALLLERVKGLVARKPRAPAEDVDDAFVFIAVFFGAFVLVNLLRMGMAVPRYFIPLFPLHFLLATAFLFHLAPASNGGFQRFFTKGRTIFLALVLAVGAALAAQYLYGWQRGITYQNQNRTTVRHWMKAAAWIRERADGNASVAGEDAMKWNSDPEPIAEMGTLLADALGFTNDLSRPARPFTLWVADPARITLPPRELLTRAEDLAQFGNLWIFRMPARGSSAASGPRP